MSVVETFQYIKVMTLTSPHLPSVSHCIAKLIITTTQEQEPKQQGPEASSHALGQPYIRIIKQENYILPTTYCLSLYPSLPAPYTHSLTHSHLILTTPTQNPQDSTSFKYIHCQSPFMSERLACEDEFERSFEVDTEKKAHDAIPSFAHPEPEIHPEMRPCLHQVGKEVACFNIVQRNPQKLRTLTCARVFFTKTGLTHAQTEEHSNSNPRPKPK